MWLGIEKSGQSPPPAGKGRNEGLTCQFIFDPVQKCVESFQRPTSHWPFLSKPS